MQAVVARRADRIEELLDEYDEEPSIRPLREASNGMVASVGPLMARVMFVGFSPGKAEDEEGEPFWGCRDVLDELLASVDMKRKDVYLTNVLKYRIPDDGNYDAAVRTSARYLRKEISIIKPWVIVPMGGDATRTLEPNVRLSNSHGKIIRYRHERSVVPLHHPASCSTVPGKKVELLRDMKSVAQALLELRELLG
jgi:DNA polymerase